MSESSQSGISKFSLAASYLFDWVVLAIAAVVGFTWGRLTPNKRPFSVTDPDISFPFTAHETIPTWLLVICNTIAPVVITLLVVLIFVPGSTIPKGTPKSLIWKLKLWEIHAGLLGLAMAIIFAWLITNGMKNLFGKPRPDLLSRCHPDLSNFTQFIVGGVAGGTSDGQLVSSAICQNTDKSTLDDGFRSFPSGHASSSAAGLIYLSLFLAGKFGIAIPSVPLERYQPDARSFSAFPSRLRTQTGATNAVVAVRRQAAAPPIYISIFAIIPLFTAIFIASSRWFDFRHHGFDILFGFFIGIVTSVFAFYCYHLPIRQGAGWAWGPRSHDKAWWAGVGSYSYATNMQKYTIVGDVETALGGDVRSIETREV